MIYDVALLLSCRPPPEANHSQNTEHFLPTDCGPDVLPLPALLSLLLIYLIDYESNPCIILCVFSLALLQRGGATRRNIKLTISCFPIFYSRFLILYFIKFWEIVITCKGHVWVGHAQDLQLSHRVMNVAGYSYTSLAEKFKLMLHVKKKQLSLHETKKLLRVLKSDLCLHMQLESTAQQIKEFSLFLHGNTAWCLLKAFLSGHDLGVLLLAVLLFQLLYGQWKKIAMTLHHAVWTASDSGPQELSCVT